MRKYILATILALSGTLLWSGVSEANGVAIRGGFRAGFRGGFHGVGAVRVAVPFARVSVFPSAVLFQPTNAALFFGGGFGGCGQQFLGASYGAGGCGQQFLGAGYGAGGCGQQFFGGGVGYGGGVGLPFFGGGFLAEVDFFRRGVGVGVGHHGSVVRGREVIRFR